MWEVAFFWALCFAVGGNLVDIFTTENFSMYRPVKANGKKSKFSLKMNLSMKNDGQVSIGEFFVKTLVTCGVLTLANWVYIYNSQPTLTGVNAAMFVVFNLFVAGAVIGLMNLLDERIGGSTPAAALGIVLILIIITGVDIAWIGSGNAKNLASQANVTIVTNGESPYPPTDVAHIPPFGDQTAKFKAEQAMNQGGLGTLYDLGSCNQQAVAGHLYYICDMLLTEHKTTQQAEYTIPGYIPVDSENPDNQMAPKLGYKIKWWPGGWFGGNLERYLWMNGYNTQYLDNLTLEVDDNWNPYYTATLNEPPLRFQPAMPKTFITVDVQTGVITPYKMDQIPAWADRVYSENVVKTMMDWWGHWGQADYVAWREKPANRYKVEPPLNLVYTDQGLAWQVLMTSWRKEHTIQYVVMVSTRTGVARAYPAPQGLIYEDKVKEQFNASARNLKSLDPVNLGLYQIYGEYVWVGGLVPNGKADDGSTQSFGGVGVLSATNPDANNVIIAGSKGEAFDLLSVQIATRPNNNTPGADSRKSSFTGIIYRISIIPEPNVGTYIVIRFKDDPTHTYRGKMRYDDDGSMALARTGDKVTIGFLDTGAAIRAIASFSLVTASSNN